MRKSVAKVPVSDKKAGKGRRTAPCTLSKAHDELRAVEIAARSGA
jgi:hypothetical protein